MVNNTVFDKNKPEVDISSLHAYNIKKDKATKTMSHHCGSHTDMKFQLNTGAININ